MADHIQGDNISDYHLWYEVEITIIIHYDNTIYCPLMDEVQIRLRNHCNRMKKLKEDACIILSGMCSEK